MVAGTENMRYYRLMLFFWSLSYTDATLSSPWVLGNNHIPPVRDLVLKVR